MKIKLCDLIVILSLLLCLKACSDGTYADASGACHQCDISCSTCRSSDGCSTCYDQMYLVARGNTIVCDLCYNINKGCDICITGTKCLNCSSGYYLETDNTCSSCNNLTPNCLICRSGNITECISCENPYQLIDGVCVSNSTSSSSSLNSINSAQTQGIATQSQNNAPTASQQPSLSSACDPSQININGICYQTIAFCQDYNQTDGSCITCAPIFTLSNGYCLPSSLVTSSNNQPSQNQASSSPSSSSASSGIIIPCTSRQFYKDGSCFDIGPQCTQFDSSTGICYACESGFQVYNGLCVQMPSSQDQTANSHAPTPSTELPNCQVADPADPTKCQTCISGYTIVDAFPGVCYQIN